VKTGSFWYDAPFEKAFSQRFAEAQTALGQQKIRSVWNASICPITEIL